MDDLLAPGDSPVGALVRGAREQQRLDAVLREFLDRPLADHVHVASARDGILTLAAGSPVWGHRVRYLAPAILDRIRSRAPDLGEVRIIVRPEEEGRAEPTPSRQGPALSRTSASLLQRVAQDCDNPALARVLARIGARGDTLRP